MKDSKESWKAPHELEFPLTGASGSSHHLQPDGVDFLQKLGLFTVELSMHSAQKSEKLKEGPEEGEIVADLPWCGRIPRR